MLYFSESSIVCSPQSGVSAFTQSHDGIHFRNERIRLENMSASDIGVNLFVYLEEVRKHE